MKSSVLSSIRLSTRKRTLRVFVPSSIPFRLHFRDTLNMCIQRRCRFLFFMLYVNLRTESTLQNRFPQTLSPFPIMSVPLPKNVTSTNHTVSPGALPSACSTVITPDCLQGLYNIPTTPATQSSNTLAVAGYSKYSHKQPKVEWCSIN